MNVIRFSSEQSFIRESISFIRSILVKSSCSIALSGGRTPEPIYRMLAKESDIPWGHVDLGQVDERYVPKANPDSNRRLIETSFSPITRRLHGWHFFDTSLPIDEALSRYEISLRETPAFDLVILGMGTDRRRRNDMRSRSSCMGNKRWMNFQRKDYWIIPN